jgi:uncharacterized protein YjbI with pentapeptide repeats
MPKLSLRAFSCSLAILLLPAISSAAVISWTGPTAVDPSGDSQVNNIDTTLVAENYFGANVTLNGVAFTGVSTGTQTTITSGLGAGVAVFYSGPNATMEPLLNPAFTDSNFGDPGYTIQVSGLTIGDSYVIQLFGGDDRPSFPNAVEVGDGNGDFSFKWGLPVLQDQGSFIVGTFVADAATQSFGVRRDLVAQPGGGGGILAGINVRERIPRYRQNPIQGGNLVPITCWWVAGGCTAIGSPHPYSGPDLEPGGSYPGVDLEGANLWSADLANANLNGANLSSARLQLANLSGAQFNNADLSGPGGNLASVDLSGASLDGANLSGRNMLLADLTNASLVGADLSDANLNGVDVTNANFFDAIVTNLHLESVELNAALVLPNLAGETVFVGRSLEFGPCTNLSGANLSGATLLPSTSDGCVVLSSGPTFLGSTDSDADHVPDEIEAVSPGGFNGSAELITFIQSCVAAPVPAMGGLGLVFLAGVLAGGGLHQSRKRRRRKLEESA